MFIFSCFFQTIRVGHKTVHFFLHVAILFVIAVVGMFIRIVALCLNTIVGVVGSLFVGLFSIVGTCLAIIAAQTTCISCAVGSTGQRTLLLHLLILLTNSANLRDVDTTLHQLGDNLRIRGACTMLLGYKTHHLIIRHA